MDKVLEFSFRSIIRNINGDTELSKEYEELALEAHYDTKCLHKVEDHVPKKVRRKLYQMVN